MNNQQLEHIGLNQGESKGFDCWNLELTVSENDEECQIRIVGSWYGGKHQETNSLEA